MKKILSLLAVFAMCISCFSCDDDKDVDDISETVSDSENTVDSGDTVVEQQFREFEESDFQTLNVPNLTSESVSLHAKNPMIRLSLTLLHSIHTHGQMKTELNINPKAPI